jgi:hypothetical protein
VEEMRLGVEEALLHQILVRVPGHEEDSDARADVGDLLRHLEAVRTSVRLKRSAASLESRTGLLKCGTVTPAKMPRTVTTMRSSTSVNPSRTDVAVPAGGIPA